jgi:hypothetical protein
MAIEAYVFYALKGTFRTGWAVGAAKWASYISFGFTLAGFGLAFYMLSQGMARSNYALNIVVGLGFIFIITNVILAAFFLIDDIARLLQWIFMETGAAIKGSGEEVSMPGRRKFIGQMGLMVAAIPFGAAVYGILKGKYDYSLHKHTLQFSDLPEAFDGLKIVQISDIHAGSLDLESGVEHGLQLIMEQKPDLILFTGDLVNNLAVEAEPFIEMFKGLSAPLGKYSVLGNHDYGHYYPFESKEAMHANHQQVRVQNARMGFQLLNNQHVKLKKDGQEIVLAGVENWGIPPFPQYGDLNQAFAGLDDGEFTILMSHDPSHWDAQVKGHRKHVHLQLSGHTHGAQFGIEIPGIKWSPAKWKYKQWGGMYSEGNQHLNVNRGFGFIGFPGRVGIWPEITVIELKKA